MSELSEVLWVLQSNRLGPAGAHDFYKLTSFLDAQGTYWKEFPYRPFDDAPVVIDWEGPVVFYGGTTFIDKVHKQSQWRPGVWYDQTSFAFESLLHGYGPSLLNHDSRVVRLQDLITEADNGLFQHGPLFVRPADDLKEFVGGVREDVASLRDLMVQSSMSRATPESRVQVASVKDLKREWRTIVVDNKVIAGSQYRDGAVLLRQSDRRTFPDEVVALAESCSRAYSPAAVFALDIGELADGGLRVIETNCFNCAGWYESDVRSIAREVTLCAARTPRKT